MRAGDPRIVLPWHWASAAPLIKSRPGLAEACILYVQQRVIAREIYAIRAEEHIRITRKSATVVKIFEAFDGPFVLAFLSTTTLFFPLEKVLQSLENLGALAPLHISRSRVEVLQDF